MSKYNNVYSRKRICRNHHSHFASICSSELGNLDVEKLKSVIYHAGHTTCCLKKKLVSLCELRASSTSSTWEESASTLHRCWCCKSARKHFRNMKDATVLLYFVRVLRSHWVVVVWFEGCILSFKNDVKISLSKSVEKALNSVVDIYHPQSTALQRWRFVRAYWMHLIYFSVNSVKIFKIYFCRAYLLRKRIHSWSIKYSYSNDTCILHQFHCT